MSTSRSGTATAATETVTEGTPAGGSRPPGRETLRSVWAGGVRSPLTWVLLAAIRLYQLTVSPMLGPVCRFYPSCSHYGFEAIRVHGALRGTWYTAYRLVRCHPWNPGGIDPVPPRRGHRGRSAPQSAGSAASDRKPTAEPAGARAGGGPDQGA